MADLVWVYENEKLPHVHGRRNHIVNTILLTPNRGQAAKTWKLSTVRYMENQFAPIKSTPKNLLKLIKDITDPKILENIEQSLQEQLVAQDNKKFNLVTNASSLDQALVDLKAAMVEGQTADGRKFIEAFDGLLTVIDNEVPTIQMWGEIISHPENGIILNPNDIVAIAELKQLMSKYLDSISATGTLGIADEVAQALFNVISKIVSENYYTGIQQIEKNVEFKVTEVFKAVKLTPGPQDVKMIGAQGEKIDSTDPITSGRIEQTADSIVKKHVKVTYDGNKYTFDLMFPATMKYYIRDKVNWVHLSQYSGKNSILMDSLYDMYGSNWSPEMAYAIYNALAFSWSSEYKNDSADKNFRIIKHDLILRTAYIYLAGSRKSLGERIFIYNKQAYPIINILQAIIDKEMDREDIFNRFNTDKYFDIEITHAGDANKWVPAEGDPANVLTPNRKAATQRIHNVLDACNTAKTRGKLKTSVLTENILKEYIKFVPGVKVDIT